MADGMAVESLNCVDATCTSSCPAGYVEVERSCDTKSYGEGKSGLRCCPEDAYPDVFVHVDRFPQSCPIRTGPNNKFFDYINYDTSKC